MTKGRTLKLLKERLEDSRHTVDVAIAQVRKAQRENEAGELPAADAHLALQAAVRREIIARCQYLEMLQVYRLTRAS